MIGYLDNELWLKENPSAEKPVKKARGGVASRKAKANSIAAHAAKAKKSENQPSTNPTLEEDVSRTSTPSKAGDLSFVLNGPPGSPPRSTPSKSPNIQPVKQPQPQAPSAPSFIDSAPSFTAEPAHNCKPYHLNVLMVVRARTKKRKVHDSSLYDDYSVEPWEEPDEAGYSEEEARRDLVEKEIRRRIKKDSKKRRRERFRTSGLLRGIPPPTLIPSSLRLFQYHVLIIEWTFMQSKLGDILNDTDRLESGSLNESDGGEECEAILTALRRAKRRSERPVHQDWKYRLTGGGGDEMDTVEDTNGEVGGKTTPHLRLTLNGH
jgi:hypothetical protein